MCLLVVAALERDSNRTFLAVVGDMVDAVDGIMVRQFVGVQQSGEQVRVCGIAAEVGDDGLGNRQRISVMNVHGRIVAQPWYRVKRLDDNLCLVPTRIVPRWSWD